MAAKTAKRNYGEGSISQRKQDGRWVARFTIGYNEAGKPIIKALYGKTEREAINKLKAFKEEFLKNDKINVQKNTVGNFMDAWLYDNKRNTLKPKSFDRLEQTIKNQVKPHIGHLQLASIQPSDVQKMINTLRDNGSSYSTIKKAYDAVNGCFRTGVIQRTVVYNPALGVTVPKQSTFKSKELRFYTKEEAQKLCETALSKYGNGERIYRMGEAVILDLNTGLRIAELLALKWDDVDLENKSILVRDTFVTVKDRSDSERKYKVVEQKSTKTRSSYRSVQLNEAAIQALSSLKEITGSSKYVLATKEGNPIGQQNLDRMLRKIEAAAGFPEDKIYGFHALRHTFASLLFANGIDVKTVSALLGHSDITITYNIYIHLIKDQKQQAVDTIKF